MRLRTCALALVALAAGCATAPKKDYAKLQAARPRSIVVLPVLNRSADADAPDYFLSTLPIPLADRGYYVFPVILVKRVLAEEGLADPALAHAADPTRLAATFGADAVLYVTVERWEAKHVLVLTQVRLEVSYVLKDGKTGDVLWTDRQETVHRTGEGGGALGALLVGAGVDAEKVLPSHLPLAREVNASALAYPGPGLPKGPYPEYRRPPPPEP